MSGGGPISEVLGTIRGYIADIVSTFPHDFGTSDYAAQVSTFFIILSILILVMKFWWDIMEENSRRKGPDRIEGLIAALKHLGLRIFILPLIVFASAIPQVFYSITPSAFLATSSVAGRVATIGDNLIGKISTVYSLYVDQKLQAILDPGTAEANGLTDQDRIHLKGIRVNYWAADWNYKQAKAKVDNLKRQQVLYKARQSSGDVCGWSADKDKELQEAMNMLPRAEQAFNSASSAMSNAASGLLPQIQAATDKASLDKANAELAGLKQTITTGSKALDGGTFEVPNPEYAKTLDEVNRLSGKISTGTDPGDSNRGFFGNAKLVASTLATVIDHIGFYLCLLPAFLGLIAGAILCLKESLGLMQYGAKLEIMKCLTLSVATAFGPLLMVCFLFKETEKYGWNFITLMFSIFFSFFAVSYVCAITLGPGFNNLAPLFNALTSISLTQYGQQASMDLFVGAVKIGLKGLGIGMITTFILDVVKSAISVGQNLFGGTFHAS